MTPKETLFVSEYCVDMNATKAAVRAGYSEKTAGQQGSAMLKKPEIAAAVSEHLKNCQVRSEITVEAILRRWWEIANVDVNELVEVRRECCRHCWGAGHAYQWTEAEYMRAVDVAVRSGKRAPDGMGGFGFDANRTPNQHCPECHGNGWERAHIHDTRTLSPAARRLYAGIQKTKDGFKIMIRDQDAALTNLARYFQMFEEKPKAADVGLAEALKTLAERLPV
jgi:hypothetical protein